MASTWDSVTVDGATMKHSWPKALAFFHEHLARVAAGQPAVAR